MFTKSFRYSAHQADVGSLAVEKLSHVCMRTPMLMSVKGKETNVHLGENGYKTVVESHHRMLCSSDNG